MSKVLVVKGANFATNKVRQITVVDPVPCTAISLSSNSLSFTEYGETKTLTATLTPVNTTDNVVWSTSDADVATVVDGVVSIKGIGTATITATCGNQTAICAVTCSSLTLDLMASDYIHTGYKINTQNSRYVNITAHTASALFYSETDVLGGYRAFYGASSNDGKYCIPIPKGATQYAATASVARLYIMTSVFDTLTVATQIYNSQNKSAMPLVAKNGRGSLSQSLEDYSAANGFVVSLTNTDDTENPLDTTVDFSITFS